MVVASPEWNELVRHYQSADINFPALKSVTLAQWALESGRGTSELSRRYLNFGGLKYRDRMSGLARPVDYSASDGVDTYCAFDSVSSFVEGYWHFVATGPYQGYDAFAEDPIGYISFLREKGYTADPSYVQKVVGLLGEIHDHLGDHGNNVTLDRPSRSTLGDYAPPRFVHLRNIVHKARGPRPYSLEGAIVHFDAYRIRRAGNGQEDSDRRCEDMLRSGQQNGYHYAEISRTGTIFLPGNFSWEEWGSHAGESLCPVTKRSGVSRYYVGFEMNNPGLLYEAQEDGVFCPWYNSRRTEKGAVILDKRNRCFRTSEHDEWYRLDEVRHCSGGNISAGWYLPYSHEQFEALVNVIRFLEREFPTTFSVDRVLGHDEVSPGRKQDPGGALAHQHEMMTMEDFRAYVRRGY